MECIDRAATSSSSSNGIMGRTTLTAQEQPQRRAAVSASSQRTQQHVQTSRWDERTFFMCYFAAVFVSRLFLRSPCSNNLHWAVIMALEDGMSLLSFALGLCYLHHTNGAPLAILAKRIAFSPEAAASTVQDAANAAVTMGASDERRRSGEVGTADDVRSVERPPFPLDAATRQSFRLFYFAM